MFLPLFCIYQRQVPSPSQPAPKVSACPGRHAASPHGLLAVPEHAAAARSCPGQRQGRQRGSRESSRDTEPAVPSRGALPSPAGPAAGPAAGAARPHRGAGDALGRAWRLPRAIAAFPGGRRAIKHVASCHCGGKGATAAPVRVAVRGIQHPAELLPGGSWERGRSAGSVTSVTRRPTAASARTGRVPLRQGARGGARAPQGCAGRGKGRWPEPAGSHRPLPRSKRQIPCVQRKSALRNFPDCLS